MGKRVRGRTVLVKAGWHTIGIVAALLTLAFPRTAWADASPEEELEKVTLQLKWKHQFQAAGFYAAIEQGYYRNEGLDVTLREATDDEDPADVVLRGDAEFGVGTSALIVLRSQGKPVVVLAPVFQHSPLVLLVSANSGHDSVHTLAGKRIMLEAHGDELLAYLHFEGIKKESINWLHHSFDPSGLIDGTVDAISAYSTDEPFLLQQAGFKYNTFTPRSGGIDFYGDTLFTVDEQVKLHPERVKRFLNASLQGWKYALTNSDEIVDLIYSKYSKRHSRNHLRFEAEMTKQLILPDVVEVGYMNPGRWMHIGETYEKMGIIDTLPPLDQFLFERNPRIIPRGLYGALFISLGLLFVVGAVAYRFYRLSVQIQQQSRSLQNAMAEIKVLSGIIPICAHCKKIRDDQGYWKQLEAYISAHSDALFSHGICDECEKQYYSDDAPSIQPRSTTQSSQPHQG